MSRFTDADSTPKRLRPIDEYLDYELVSLKEALDPIRSQVNELDRCMNIAKYECHFPSEHGLTHDESAAIFLYTMECGTNSFYRVINRALRSEDRRAVKAWFPYLKLFDSGVQKLPTRRANIWRGAIRDVTKNFNQDDEFTWWSISSCSSSVDVIKKFLESNSTLFLIEALHGKDISKYTNYTNEDEVILCPGTRLRVVSDALDLPNLHIVHLREVGNTIEEQLSSVMQGMTIEDLTERILGHTTKKRKSATVITYIDMNDNEYENNTFSKNNVKGEMKDEKKHGKGSMKFPNGDKYMGDWFNGKRTGQDDRMHGKGKMDYVNGDTYVGDWFNGERTGHGVYIFNNGDRYE